MLRLANFSPRMSYRISRRKRHRARDLRWIESRARLACRAGGEPPDVAGRAEAPELSRRGENPERRNGTRVDDRQWGRYLTTPKPMSPFKLRLAPKRHKQNVVN